MKIEHQLFPPKTIEKKPNESNDYQIIKQKVSNAWSDNSVKSPPKNAEITEFINKLRTTHDKMSAYFLLNQKLSSLFGENKSQFIANLIQELKNTENQEDNLLLDSIVNPAYALYFSFGMINEQFKEQILSKIGETYSYEEETEDNDDI